MTRYYYDNGLATAWMAEQFGMRFVSLPLNTEINGDDLLDVGGIIEARVGMHPDSLPLLEPQVGDLIHIVRGFCSYFKIVEDIAKGGGKSVTGIWSNGEHWDVSSKEPLHDWEIIQRNGKLFHWPLSE